ncbi:MAG TPA: Uma2 family endonuclease [Kofleriaceae bacterium]|nr:Uma2 family endonuclease [Kofleriaceae bacterium]
MVQPARRPVTFEDLLARDDADRLEIIGGEIVEKAMPSVEHSWSEGKLVAVTDPFNRKPGSRGPGGWWILPEIHVEYPNGEVYCHDLAGWRRARVPERPTGWPVRIRPDWVCEIVSPKHEKQDLVVKPLVLHAAEVPHYWIVDPVEQILLVHRWSVDGYTVVLRAAAGDTVRAEPFDAIELRVGVLFGEEDDD